MTWIYTLAAIFIVALIFEVSPKLGGVLVIVLVLGMLLTAKNKGMV